MEKSKELQIFQIAHKIPPYGLTDDEFHTPIHAGKELHKDIFVCDLCDNTLDNISDQNYAFRELTAIYWIWKNVHDVEFVGHEHYRRRYALCPSEIIGILNSGKNAIMECRPLDYRAPFVAYSMTINPIDITAATKIIKRKYPNMEKACDEYFFKRNDMHWKNMFIAKKEDYDEMCEFVFDIIFEFRNLFNLTTEERVFNYVSLTAREMVHIGMNDPYNKNWQKYMLGLFGFLSEILFSFYAWYKFDYVYNSPMYLKEGV